MARPLRYETVSEANIYHVTARGAGKRIIFEDDEDRLRYIRALSTNLKTNEGRLLAWCLMDNHVHLLVQMEIHALSNLMQRLHTTYAQYFNGRHGHIGHVFQGRYDSNPVNTDEQLMLTVAYIHKNPKDIADGNWAQYRWSSYREYLGRPQYCQIKLVLNIFGGKEAFLQFHRGKDTISEVSLVGSKKRLSDAEAESILKARYGENFCDGLQLLSKKKRNAALVSLSELGLSARQIERLTGIGRNIVARATIGREV